MSLLARTYYQSSLVDYLKSGSRAAEEFKEEVERAFLKGMNERELIVQKIDSLITRSNDLFRLKEETNNQWQDVYYRTCSEPSTAKNIRSNLALVLEKQDEYNQLHKSGLSDLENIQIQKDLISQTTDLSFQAIDLADKAQMTLHEMLVICINPLVSIFEDEISSAEKILSQIQLKGQKKSDDLSDDEIGKLCDVLSWGLDDINNYDELTKVGKELRNEFASILSDFLVYLVDIDLGIQELESFILESSEK
jgi:hypothetical protein